MISFSRSLQVAALTGVAVLSIVPAALAQRGFSPEESFRRMDANGDGTITADEASRMPSFMREEFQKQGLDFNRGVRQKDFERSAEKAFESIRERFRSSSGGPPGGGPPQFGGPPGGGPPQFGGPPGMGGPPQFGGPPPGSDRSRGDDRSRDERDRGDDRNRDERGREDSNRSGTTKPGSQRVIAKTERITVDLQESFKEGDADQDGQIAFFEWRKWKPGELAEFNRMDQNHDGYLTPREIKYSSTATASPTAVAASATPATPAPVVTPAAVSAPGPVTDEDRNSTEGKRAVLYVGQLDKNKNGTIEPDEWSISKTVKPQFEQAGIDLKAPMPTETFIAHFIRLNRKG